MWNPEILPNPNAIDGHVESLKTYDIHTFRRNDAILCRNTAPLISMAFSMIARDIPVNVLGRDILFVSSQDKLKRIEIFDVSGKSCFLKTSNFLDSQINISSLSKGIYTVKVVDEKKSLQSKLVVY